MNAAALVKPAVRLSGVSYTFPRESTPAFSDVDLSIDAGEVVALVGPSGAGKTTLLSLLDSRLRGWKGEAQVNGLSLSSNAAAPRAARALTGFVFQDFALIHRRSVRRNVMNGRLGHLSLGQSLLGRMTVKDEQAVNLAMAQTGIERLADRRVDALSGGQRQRVAIARCLAQDPELILADEPVSSLDPQSSKDILEVLADVTAARGATLIFTSHQPELALTIATRMIGLQNGRVVLDAPAADITEKTLARVYAEGELTPPSLRLVG